MKLIACLFFACLPTLAGAQTGAGVSRELAAMRAADISQVRYRLSFDLEPHADSTTGREELRFASKHAVSLPIDFREGTVTEAVLNGKPLRTALQDGHLVRPAIQRGENVLSMDFTAPVALAGKAITRFEDKDDGSEYIYTLFVPMDASMAFPCFDQPDLKGRFTLDVTAPVRWTVVSNSAVVTSVATGERQRVSFGETRPISTYLFAFAAGPFENVHASAGMPNVYVRRSQLARAQPEVPQIRSVVTQGTEFLARYFAQPFPFPKYDMVLLPGFAYGGMEHAGATFLREDSMLFRTAPTDTDRFNRSITLLHELAHQWFGDFVTMRWFDDLWLKEGFAQFMAFRTMAEIKPPAEVWKRFYQSIKPAAYGIDITQGTTPIYQDIPNLTDAKSAYGAIVYSKAPALLRQLAYLLGDEAFRDGLRLYLRQHAYDDATWNDLVGALEQASHRQLESWASAWIHRRGVPEVRDSWSCNANGQLAQLSLSQSNVLGERGVWPIATQILLGYRADKPQKIRVQFSSERISVSEAIGKPCPDYVFANDEDYAYAVFLLDERSRDYAMHHLASIADSFERTLLWGGFWDAVRFVELDPRKYLELSLVQLPEEHDEAQVQSLGGRTAVALHDYVGKGDRSRFDAPFERMAIDRMLDSRTEGLRIMWFRNVRAWADEQTGFDELRKLLAGEASVPGVALRPLDRWGMVTTLLAHEDAAADGLYQSEKQRDHSGDGLKYSYMAGAAKPEATNKQWYFHDYLANPARPEDWVEQSLGAFNFWNQSALTEPFLKPALDALPQMKRERKIFFVLAWLNAFIGGQDSDKADEAVHAWLKSAPIDADLKLKVLQVADDLDRTVQIRNRFPESQSRRNDAK